MLTNAERNLLEKIAAKTKMDCWFSLVDKEDGSVEAFDLEYNEPMTLTKAIGLLLEGIENVETFEQCNLTEEEKSLLKGIASRFEILFDIPERTLRVIALHPLYKAAVITIENTLEAKQNFVGGLIEAVDLDEDGVTIICNENGKVLGLPVNRCLYDKRGCLYDAICGPALVVGSGYSNFCSLNDEQIQKYLEKFRYPQQLIRFPDGAITSEDFTYASDWPEEYKDEF